MLQLLAYIKYWLKAVSDHSLHSPFLFEFYQDVVKPAAHPELEHLIALKKQLMRDQTILEIDDMGAGSRVTRSNTRSIREITKHAATPTKFSKLLYRLVGKYQPKVILELGTSLGLNTLYLSKAHPEAQVYTFEGAKALSSFAQAQFEKMEINNVQLIEGNLDATLDEFVQAQDQIDFVYMDANHRKEPTLRYFELIRPKLSPESIVVIDDIHWSQEMNEAWRDLKQRSDVSISLDLFEAGILFFKSDFTKTDLTLKY